MKFKSIFLLFNVVILVSFLFVFAMPFFALGGAFALSFWGSNWPLAAVLLLILAGVDGFFFANLRLFSLLEREDWPALVAYLEDRVLKRGRYSSRLVRLLANTYLVLSDSAAVVALESKAAAAKPVLLDRNAMVFGTARVLSGDHAGAAAFFAEREASGKAEAPEWVRWYRAFALLLGRDFSAAADILSVLAAEAKDPLVIGLAAYFLDDAVRKALPDRAEALHSAAEEGKARVLKGLPSHTAWNKETEKSRTEIHVVVLAKSLDDAGRFLYAPEAKA